jgi:hypothetical protein
VIKGREIRVNKYRFYTSAAAEDQQIFMWWVHIWEWYHGYQA